LVGVAENDVPGWLWRREPERTAKQSRGETSLPQVIDRVAGGWTYQGWKGGYFDTEEDSRNFYDECRWLLFHQKISPTIKQWQYAGRHWAYGHDVSVPSTYLTDYRSGTVRRAEKSDLPPYGLVINATGAALAGEGGVWDLWRREGEILAQGGSCGVNVSNLEPAQSPDTVTELADILAIGDTMAQSAYRVTAQQSPKRRITIDDVHPDSRFIARRPFESLAGTEADAVGTALARRHIQAIIDACLQPQPSRKKRPNAGLQLALQSARQALLPEHLIERTLNLVDSGFVRSPDDLLGNCFSHSDTEFSRAPGEAVTVIRLKETPTENADSDVGDLDLLIGDVLVTAWSGIETGLQFESAAEASNTCPSSGPVRSASGDGSFMFLDDTASDLWLVNAPAFQDDNGVFDLAGYQHAVELVTIAADLSLMSVTAVTPRLARRAWDFRPLSISLTGLARCLMAAGVAYDSGAGRALCAGLGALLTSTAYRVSAQMATERGQFPEYAKNSEDMGRVLDRHNDMVANCAHQSSPPGLVEAIEESWSEALRLGEQEGFRNAQVSVLCGVDELATIMDSGPSGLSPTAELFACLQTPAGYYEKQINPAVRQGLRALGYDDIQVATIVRHVAGHGTLANAPGVNHETLRKRGFTKAAIDMVELALSHADDITMAFNPFVLGEDFCRQMLGFTSAEMHNDGFDMLAALGFSDAGIEAANIFCCGAGSMEGAPHLAPEHLGIFDCAEPQGARGTRYVSTTGIVKMMGSFQPHISGAIGQAIAMPAKASLDEYRTVLELARQLNLKSITLQRRVPVPTAIQPISGIADADDQALPALSVIQGGPLPASPAALSPEEPFQDAETGIQPNIHSRTVVADGVEKTADDSKPSRRASSHAARSTASVSSSADVVSSNGMFDVASP
jgi:ribonucleoside-diphosphate reductase alpha chain